MTQEDRKLFLKDLSARLCYGVKVTWDGKHPLTVTPHIYCAIASECNTDNLPKLLLRPMSSMTIEEKKEYIKECDKDKSPSMYDVIYHSVDWLNKKMFDYHKDDEGKTMIDKGLALEAPEGMYRHFGNMDMVVTSVKHKNKL